MADEIVKNTESTATSTTTPVLSNEERVAQINNMYQGSLNANKANLEAQYQQSLSNAQADKANLATSYAGQRNNIAAQYERQRRNNNLQAAANGLNTGAGSQMALAQSAGYQSNMASLAKAQAQQEAEADRGIADLTTQYQIAVNEAIANNDYQKSAALLDEFNNQKQYALKQAETLAQYGDFSGYGALGYGTDQVNNMRYAWLASNGAKNGDLAYLTGQLDKAYAEGLITAEQYKNIHGGYPAGSPEAQAASSGGGGPYYNPDGQIDKTKANQLIKEISAIGTTAWQNQALASVQPSINKATYNYIVKNITP